MARLALLVLAPWALLAALGGGLHSHSLGAAASAARTGPDVAGARVPIEAPRPQCNDVASRDGPCTACLWQLCSSASSPAPPGAPASLPAAACARPSAISLCGTHVRGFDSRAPPLA